MDAGVGFAPRRCRWLVTLLLPFLVPEVERRDVLRPACRLGVRGQRARRARVPDTTPVRGLAGGRARAASFVSSSPSDDVDAAGCQGPSPRGRGTDTQEVSSGWIAGAGIDQGVPVQRPAGSVRNIDDGLKSTTFARSRSTCLRRQSCAFGPPAVWYREGQDLRWRSLERRCLGESVKVSTSSGGHDWCRKIREGVHGHVPLRALLRW